MKKHLFSIIGAGSGQLDGLTREALDTIKLCDILISTERLADSLGSVAEITAYETSELAEAALSLDEEHIGILVSGDTGFFSVAGSLNEKLKDYGSVEMICGLNSMQMLCEKFGTSYEDACFLSLHGRKGSLLGAVSYNKKVIALTGGKQNAQKLCQALSVAGLGDITVSIGENIGAESERILTDTAKNLSEQEFADLSVMLVRNPNAADCDLAVSDTEMERGKVPMTKQEVRWTAVKMLNLKPSDVVYDIGAGTGSVSVEMARKAYNGMVYAIEQKKEAIELIEKNRKKSGSFNVLPIEGEASEIIDKLPEPNAVFIGGSGGKLSEIIEKLLKKNPKVRIIISAVSLETISEAEKAVKNFDKQDIIQIHSVYGHKTDDKTEFMSNNPVYLFYGSAEV